MHGRLGFSRGAAGEEPDRGIVAMGVGVGQAVGRALRQLLEGAVASSFSHHDEMSQMGERVEQRLDPVEGGFVHDGHAGSAVLEIVDEILGREDGVDHGDDGPHLRRPEPGESELGPIGKYQKNAVLDRDAQLPQGIPEAIGPGLDLPVGVGLVAVVEAALVASPLLDVAVEEVPGHVEALRELHRGRGHGIPEF
jgi:hypothetical protein